MNTKSLSGVVRVQFCAALVAVAWMLFSGGVARACPFCSAASQTLSEELAAAEVAVIAKLVKTVPPPSSTADDPVGLDSSTDPDSGKATFEILEVLRGEKTTDGLKQIHVVYFGENEQDKSFMITGVSGQAIDWTTPLPLSPRAVSYVKQLGSLPEKGVDRLKFFLQHFEDKDPLLAQDAYDEFARAPYGEIVAMTDHMDREQLRGWIEDSGVGPTRRRLYLTLLGVCGQESDIVMLEALLRYDYQQMKPGISLMVAKAGLHGSVAGVTMVDELVRADVRRKRQCLDALIAAYLKLKGPEGMPLVEQLFLSNPAAEYTHVYATIMALRFHGEESNEIPRERLQAALRLVLENTEIADQVIPDLARWEDWSILDRLVTMFKASESGAWIRQPVISYLLVAEEQPKDIGKRATAALAELEQLDPKGVKRARSYASFGLLARQSSKGAAKQDGKSEEKKPAEEKAEEKVMVDSSTPTDSEPLRPAGTLTATGKSVVEKSVVEEKKTAVEEKPAPAETVASTPVDDTAEEPGPNRLMIVGVPLVSGILLLGVFALLLRGSDIRPPSEGA
ncbi:MAG: hypothetical protein GXP26_13020 [Planctomycetes bacterium]|nr:hypothetical protein [Planctomycetota bacterium]